MRALSVRPPWSDLIVRHGKDVENRSWVTSYRGWLYIHSGKSVAPEAYAFAEKLGVFLPPPKELAKGCIIGRAYLADISPSDSAWAIEGFHHWHLTWAEEVEPIPAKGRLGLWIPEYINPET